jgi:hypothetical protein
MVSDEREDDEDQFGEDGDELFLVFSILQQIQ